MKKINKTIAVFVKNLTSGGAEKQAILLAKALVDDYDVHFIILNGDKLHQKYLDLLKEEERVKVVMFKGGHLKRFVSLIKYLKENRVDAIFSYLTAANAYACIASLFHRMKVFTGLRNAELPPFKRLADMLMTNIFADMAVANCYSGKNNFSRQGFRKSKIEVIPNCFEHIMPYMGKENNGPIHIITVGRFVAQKDYETAIKSISLVLKVDNNIHFDLVGYGELEEEIRFWLKKYNIVNETTVYINPSNIPELLDKADVYLSTSLFEGTSNSIMEGMNANMPIVCTDVGDNSYLVKDNYNGFLVSVKNSVKLADGVLKLIKDARLRSLMGINSKQHLQENYSVEIFKEKYIRLLAGFGL